MDVPVADVLGEVALVLAVSALFGAGARRLGQPAVIGQILAGIALGPTLLGRLPGHLASRLFPYAALGYLDVLAQVAVVIFTFTVGYELRWPARNRHGRAPLLVAASALLVPMVLGAGIALADRSGFEAAGQTHITRPFVLFMAVALSITALPVLAAIVRERGIAGTVPGAIAVSAAGLMDVAAWLVLAMVLTSTADQPGHSWAETVVGLLAAFVAFMLLAVRPALRWWHGRARLYLQPLAAGPGDRLRQRLGHHVAGSSGGLRRVHRGPRDAARGWCPGCRRYSARRRTWGDCCSRCSSSSRACPPT